MTKLSDEQIEELYRKWGEDIISAPNWKICPKEDSWLQTFKAGFRIAEQELRSKPLCVAHKMIGTDLEMRATEYHERTDGRAQSYYDGWRECEYWIKSQIRHITPEQWSQIREALELALSFTPKGPVQDGLFPTSYHTLNYESEITLQDRVDKARSVLELMDSIRK